MRSKRRPQLLAKFPDGEKKERKKFMNFCWTGVSVVKVVEWVDGWIDRRDSRLEKMRFERGEVGKDWLFRPVWTVCAVRRLRSIYRRRKMFAGNVKISLSGPVIQIQTTTLAARLIRKNP